MLPSPRGSRRDPRNTKSRWVSRDCHKLVRKRSYDRPMGIESQSTVTLRRFFEMLGPTLDGPVYVRLAADGTRLDIGGEYQLDADQVGRWIDVLASAKQRMRRRVR